MSEQQEEPRSLDEDVQTEYANNVAFEQTVWDLKLLFGEYSHRHRQVDWHTSITVPWAQAKLMLHFLTINVASYELHNGPIKVPPSMIPGEPDPPPDPTNPRMVEFYEMVKRHREEFLISIEKPL